MGVVGPEVLMCIDYETHWLLSIRLLCQNDSSLSQVADPRGRSPWPRLSVYSLCAWVLLLVCERQLMIKALAELHNCIHEDPAEIAILCSWQMA